MGEKRPGILRSDFAHDKEQAEGEEGQYRTLVVDEIQRREQRVKELLVGIELLMAEKRKASFGKLARAGDVVVLKAFEATRREIEKKLEHSRKALEEAVADVESAKQRLAELTN